MDIGHITQLAKDELGNQAKCAYRQDLTGPSGQDHLKVDELGAGDFIFVDSGVAGSEPQHSDDPEGLLLSVRRPVGASGNMGSWAAANVQGVALADTLLLFAIFARPSQVPVSAQYVQGTYAPSLLMNISTTLMGATSQFRPEGVRLNLPGTGLGLNRPLIASELQAKLFDPQHPSVFCLVLRIDRAPTATAGKAWLFVGNDEADSVAFSLTNLTATTPILDLRAGIGTASGVEYRASVYLRDFQIWAPTP